MLKIDLLAIDKMKRISILNICLLKSRGKMVYIQIKKSKQSQKTS